MSTTSPDNTAAILPEDEILFSLEHVAKAWQTPNWSASDTGDILTHFAAFARDVLAPLNATGDAEGAQLKNGRVQMPAGFAAAYGQLADNGWQGLSAPEAFGGLGASPLVAAGVSELFSGANHAMQMVCNLVPGAITTLRRFGSTTQQDKWIPQLASGALLSTMCLTEPQSGSDLSTIRTMARPRNDGQEDGEWLINGEKIFISGGDQDLSGGIIHLVLARTGTMDDGIRGLSLFLCPAQPAIKVSRIEEKLGLHASPTCALSFEDAEAELIGPLGAGLKQMFTLMNHARLDVALQGVAHASRAAAISRTYADERAQGRGPDGNPVTLSNHADVVRMLDQQRRLELGARAMCHVTLVEMQTDKRPALPEFLTPLCKVFGSEAGITAADLGIQIFGGYGYLRDYGIEQHWRDARITAIYEGANGIHEKTVATRGLRDGGGSIEFAELIIELAAGQSAVLAKLDRWRDHKTTLLAADDVLPLAHDFATATADLFYHACWARIAANAEHHPAPEEIDRLATGLGL